MNDTSPDIELQVISLLKECGQEGDLTERVPWYEEMTTLQRQFRSHHAHTSFDLIVAAMPVEVAGERVAKGIPLLDFHDLTLEWEEVKLLFEKVLRLISKYSPEREEDACVLDRMLHCGSTLEEVCDTWYEYGSSEAFAGVSCVGADLVDFAVHSALHPFLANHREALISLMDLELWRRKACPICGGKPDLSLLTKAGTRNLVCCRCDARWLFQRLECAFCDNDRPDKMAYYVDESGIYRLYVCDACRSYLKGIDLRDVQPDVLLPLERIRTLDLDRQAQSWNYVPGQARKALK